MEGWALALMVVFLVLTIPLRVAISVRTTGQSGVVSPRGAPPIVRLGNLLFLLGLLVGTLNLVLAVVDVIEVPESLDTTAAHVAGVTLCLIGIAGTMAAQAAMGDAWRLGIPAERTRLVTDGVFRWSRNPGFMFMVLAGLGFLLLVPTWLGLVGFGLLLAGVVVQARLVEEPHLRQVHGDAYGDYAGRTGRFVPGVGRLR